MNRYVCLHGHFYQPPRENPWLEEVEMQDSAHPFHDWNERITVECYGPNGAARILDRDKNISDIVNNYAGISFNFGPTLLSWLERHTPRTYAAVLDADKASAERFSGHGSALAQVYNHMIMPLASRRDKATQVAWGLEDFRSRFGREAEGMWLPETAVDTETLEVLAEMGVRFTILAPRQASRVRPLGAKVWKDVAGDRVDPTTPYLCRLPSGQEIALFFYDGPISQDMAFGDMLKDGKKLKDRLMGAFTDKGRDWPQIVHVATDGETYGHHHSFGEMALAYCLRLIETDPDVTLTNYGEYLEKHPPLFEADIFENSSWSCIHGVERWRSDCGCNSGGHPGWDQGWRAPLREAVDWLRDETAAIFEEASPLHFKDPWLARDRYIEVMLDRSMENVDRFLSAHAVGPLSPQDTIRSLKLLEMQRFAQLSFTSCAWFFDDISGIETVQILQYAARAIQLAGEVGGRNLEEGFIRFLERAPSNVDGVGNGAQVYDMYANAARVDMLRAGAHYAISSLFEVYPEEYGFASFKVTSDMYVRRNAGRSSLATGKARITSNVTREHMVFLFAALHAGDHNVTCGVTFFQELDQYTRMEKDLVPVFERGDITQAVRVMDEHFGKHTYSIWHLFRDEQRKVVHEVLQSAYQTAEAAYRQIYESNYAILNFLGWLHMPLPSHFLDAARYVVETDLKRLFDPERMDIERLGNLLAETRRCSLKLDEKTLGFVASEWLSRRMEEFEANQGACDLLEHIRTCLVHFKAFSSGQHLWKAQNIFFRLWKERLESVTVQADKGDTAASRWLKAFKEVGELLRVRPA